jgi:hypothetical protein
MGSSVSVSEEALGMFILGAGGCDIAEECRMTGAQATSGKWRDTGTAIYRKLQSLFVYENAGLHIWKEFLFSRVFVWLCRQIKINSTTV